ncbi:MAG: glycosyltransferase [Chloroflexi bacterium]|nr:MAG: glycosyltransferase [Chloroflexota bacterium]
MTTESIPEVRSMPEDWQARQGDDYVHCSVGIMAHNEEANIGRTIRAVLQQQVLSVCIVEVIVVASGCTDRTVPIVAEIALQEPRVRVCVQEKREGKASAINLFLKQASSPIVVLIGADVLPTFMGHTVHLLWRLHDHLARTHPKLGEVIAFRNVISGIPIDSPVDEISIQALISQLGYQLIYEPACIVYNKGPLTVTDFLKQRRRIYAGHLQVRDQQNYVASTMKAGPIARQLIARRDLTLSAPKQMMWTLGAVTLEGFARMQGYYDYRHKREHHIWQMVDSTKDLEAGKQKVRRLCNAQSVLVFRFMLEGAQGYDMNPEGEDREATEAARKLLPLLRSKIRKEDKLSINGPGIMTAVIRAEQHGAELVARRIQEVVEATPVRTGMRGRKVKVTVAYSSLTFGLKAKNGGVTVSSPLFDEVIIAAQATDADEKGNITH